ncbi:glycoside hydrolase family 16 protein [Pseudarthrobacter defluvii]|uniref:glycoside hydrolase family 16 protein n=1 Tax=Pseudarthrobacter defluvii TaxID=410837 RepID=UPI0027D83DAC|nr:family 16 glycosylhydrolase [Pseudarthrobacter defluvii]
MMNKVLTCSSNVSVMGGELRLQMSSPGQGALVATNPNDGVAGHTGASFGLGFYEARILFPGTCTTIHNWPAWWTTGQSWPLHGENDIAEPLSGTMHSNYHSPSRNITVSIPGCWAGEFHTYGLHRKAGRNDIYFDGVLIQSYSTQDGAAPHFLIINVGSWSGSQVFGPPGAVRVDYARVWK